jgi:hypothetical protein
MAAAETFGRFTASSPGVHTSRDGGCMRASMGLAVGFHKIGFGRPRVDLRRGAYWLAALLAASVACSRDKPSAAPAEVESVTSALSGACNDGSPCAFTMVTPHGLSPSALLLSATSSLKIDDRVTLKESNGNPAAIANLGTATLQIGTDGHLGDIWSLGPVTVSDRTVVNGTIHGAVTVTKGNSVTIKAQDHTAFTTTTATSSVTFPTNNSGAFLLQPGATGTLGPGAYAAVTANARSVLNLSTGSYLVESLDLESQSTLALNTTAGPITLYVRTTAILRGNITNTTGAQSFTLVYLGTQALSVVAPLGATVIAPAATINVTPVQPISGAFFGSAIEVFSGDTVTHVPASVPTIAAREGQIQAVSFDARSGGQLVGTEVNQLSGGAWLLYRGVDFGQPGQYNRISFELNSPSGANQIVVHVDSPTGPTVATLQTFPTGPGRVAEGAALIGTVSGVHDTYLVFNGSESDTLDWFILFSAPTPVMVSNIGLRGPMDAGAVDAGTQGEEKDVPENVNWMVTQGAGLVLAAQASMRVNFTPPPGMSKVLVQSISTGLVPPAVALYDQNSNPIPPTGSITVTSESKVIITYGPLPSQRLTLVVTNTGTSSATVSTVAGVFPPQ